MKVLFTIHDLGTGGSERAIVAQANGLAREGHRVILATFLPDPRQDMAGELVLSASDRVAFAFRSPWSFGQLRPLARFLRRFRPDVVVSESLVSTVPLKLVRPFVPSFRLVVREGNVLLRHGILNRTFAWFTEWMVAAYFVNSQAIRSDLIDHGISPKKVSVIYNGISPSFFEPPRQDSVTMREQLGIPAASFVILHIGSMSSPQKAQDVVLKAVAQTPGLNDAAVVFVGDGHLLARFRASAEELQLSHRTFFVGNRSDVRELLHAADVFAFPSRWEGMPNAVLEAMACGVPIVATPAGGIPEILRDGQTGLLVPFDDPGALGASLMRIRTDPGLAGEMAERAQKAVASIFRWDRNVQELERLLVRVID